VGRHRHWLDNITSRDGRSFSSTNGRLNWALVVLSRIDCVPSNCNRSETDKHHGSVVHRLGRHWDSSRCVLSATAQRHDQTGRTHAEEDDRKRDPDNGNSVLIFSHGTEELSVTHDEEPEFSEGEWCVSDIPTTPDQGA
jgi:hypothetical protein